MGLLKRLQIFFQVVIGGLLCIGGWECIDLTINNNPFTPRDYIGIICCLVGFLLIMTSENGVKKRR
jgi:hypothetical protein